MLSRAVCVSALLLSGCGVDELGLFEQDAGPDAADDVTLDANDAAADTTLEATADAPADTAACDPQSCPGTDTECHKRSCADGGCGFDDTAKGTKISAQVPGDCHSVQCDGVGGQSNVVDDTDVPDDKNPCTVDKCTAGTASHDPVASGTTCGTGLVCDGKGACVGCVTPSQCPGTDTACDTRTCTSGTCGHSFTTQGTPTPTQTAGDCHVSQCDGACNIVSAIDNGDVPVDGKQCTGDVCTAGVPSNPPLASGTACNQTGGSVCNGAGTCVQCVVPTTCSGTDTDCQTRTCQNNTCGVSFAPAGTATSSQTAGDCKKNVCNGSGSVTSANDDADVPVDGNQCTSDVCTAGVPSNPPLPTGTGCNQGGGSVCSAGGLCVQCNVASTCPGTDTDCQTPTCVNNACGVSFAPSGTPTSSQTSGDCKQNQCNGAGGVVSANDDGDVPVDGNPCTNDVCTAGVPSNPPVPVGTTCNQGGLVCNATGQCVQCVLAATCPGTDTDCQTRTCVNNACGFSFAPSGTLTSSQTSGDCKQNQCDGSGGVVSANDDTDVPVDGNQCTADVCTLGVPSNPPEPAGTTCNQGGTTCDGAGVCQ